MSAVTVQEIVEALVKCGSSALNIGLPNTAKYLAGLADRIEAHGIAPPDGRTPVAWAIDTPYGRAYSYADELLGEWPVPDGWVLVPKEPTYEMLRNAIAFGRSEAATVLIWTAMLAAAPLSEPPLKLGEK